MTDTNARTIPRVAPETLDRNEAMWIEASSRSFLVFVRGLYVPTQDRGVQMLDHVMADFQREFFEDIAPSLTALRDGEKPECQRWWIERTKKASKDGDLAVIVAWMLAFPKRPMLIQIGAADKDQAAIVKDRIKGLLHVNPWLNSYVKPSRNRVVGAGGLAETEIVAADAASAHGTTPDLLILNELSHIQKWEFAENAKSNADGVARGIMVVATNAGFRGTPQETWKINAEQSPYWRCHVWSRPAPWIELKFVEDAQRTLPPGVFSRLWRGKWASGKGDAVSEDDIEAAFSYGLQELTAPESGWWYVGGLDLGTKRDHAGMVLLGVHQQQQVVRLAWMRGWAPEGPDHEVPLLEVAAELRKIHQRFRPAWIGYDPEQAVHMAQGARAEGIPMQPVTFGAANLRKMAAVFVQALGQRWLRCYDDAAGTLRRDFGKFSIVEKQYGVRLEATRDAYGHADVGTALLIALLRAEEVLRSGVRTLGPEDDLVYRPPGENAGEVWQSMPAEFLEILGRRPATPPPLAPNQIRTSDVPDWARGGND